MNVSFSQTDSDPFLLLQGPTFTADTVVGRDGFLVGAEASYNVTAGNISRYAAALGYNTPEYSVTVHGLNNFNTFSASYYHRVSSDVEAAAKAVYDAKSHHGGVNLEVGSKTYVICIFVLIYFSKFLLFFLVLSTRILLLKLRSTTLVSSGLVSISSNDICQSI